MHYLYFFIFMLPVISKHLDENSVTNLWFQSYDTMKFVLVFLWTTP